MGFGDGCRAAKSARSSPRGRDGGHRRLRFGVEGTRLSGELVGVDGKLRVGSQADDRRRFLGAWEEACPGEAVAALVMEIGL